jgi:hypothetical protein
VHVLSFSEAIKTYKIARSTFYKYVTNGNLSVVDTPHNPKSKRGVHVSEIDRVFGPPKIASSGEGYYVENPRSMDETVHRRAKTTIDNLVDSLYSQVEISHQQLDNAHSEKSRLLDILEAKLLSAPEEKTHLPTTPPVAVVPPTPTSWSGPILSQDERDELVVPDRTKKRNKKARMDDGLEPIDTEGMWQKKKGKKKKSKGGGRRNEMP